MIHGGKTAGEKGEKVGDFLRKNGKNRSISVNL